MNWQKFNQIRVDNFGEGNQSHDSFSKALGCAISSSYRWQRKAKENPDGKPGREALLALIKWLDTRVKPIQPNTADKDILAYNYAIKDTINMALSSLI